MNFEDIKEKIKNITPKQWLYIGIGLLVIIILYSIFNKSSSSYTQPPITRSSSPSILDGGGTSGNANSGGSSGMDNGVILDYQNQTEDLKNKYSVLANQFDAYKYDTNKVLEKTEKNFNDLQRSLAFESSLNNISSIYFNDKNDAREYNQISKSVGASKRSKNLTSKEAERVKNKVAGIGNAGIGWDQDSSDWKDTMSNIKNNSSYKESELDRTNRVIANRKKQGLDTKAQERYKEQINNDFKDFD